MQYTSIFHLLSELSKKTDASCVLIGGFAINFYNVTRQTTDVDLLITKSDFDKLSVELIKAGFHQDYAQEVFVRFTGNSDYLMDIDFMFVDKEVLEKIAGEGKKISIGKHQFIVPSIRTLIALKLHSIKNNRKLREYKDLPDIINLIRVNKVDFRDAAFREMCVKYGNEELYKKIVSALE